MEKACSWCRWQGLGSSRECCIHIWTFRLSIMDFTLRSILGSRVHRCYSNKYPDGARTGHTIIYCMLAHFPVDSVIARSSNIHVRESNLYILPTQESLPRSCIYVGRCTPSRRMHESDFLNQTSLYTTITIATDLQWVAASSNT